MVHTKGIALIEYGSQPPALVPQACIHGPLPNLPPTLKYCLQQSYIIHDGVCYFVATDSMIF